MDGVMQDTRDTIKDIGPHWNEKRFAVAQVKQGCLQESERMKVGESKMIDSLKNGSNNKSLKVLENIRQEENLVLKNAEKVYLKRLIEIWTSPLSYRSDQSLLTYFMQTQVWPIAGQQRLDSETRKIMVKNRAKHPQGSTELLHLPRSSGGRRLESV